MSTLNTGTLSGTVSTAGVLTGMLSISTDYRPALMQEKTVTPADVAQVITPDTGYGGAIHGYCKCNPIELRQNHI